MKQKTPFKVLLIATLALFGATYCYAAAGHDNGNGGHSYGVTKPAAQEPQGGPNGGRLITIVEPYLEFLVTPERFVQITFLGRDGQVLPVVDQVVSAIGGDRSAPTKVEFVEDEGRLISTAALPEIKRMPIILQIKTTLDAERVREAFYLNMSGCSGCEYKEYACICGH
mgnify:CR=1 FL=1|tara:strand:- start:668 stop:1174 length:507 start_codon:yes stop_codon:yes gene_type:complete